MISEQDTIVQLKTDCAKQFLTIIIESKRTMKSCCYTIISPDKELLIDAKKTEINNSVFKEVVKIIVQLWEINNPKLYNIKINLIYENNDTEEITDKFGFRTIKADEKHIYINDKPFYMRGYIRGHKAHEHNNNCNLSLKEFYKKNILTAKKYGFNTIRFHTTIPPKECFEAADECGIMLHIELRDKYDNLSEMINSYNDFISNEDIKSIIMSYYNHPSLMVYCIGNEIKNPGNNKRIREIGKFIKSIDDTRLFIDTCAHGEYDREGVDFDVQHMSYYFPYGRHFNMYEDTYNLQSYGSVKGEKLQIIGNGIKITKALYYKRPVIAHEICHYTALRDFKELKKKFVKNNIKEPWWIDEEIKMIGAKGYSDIYQNLLKASKYFQYKCWKTAFEALRMSNFLQGFHMLQFADTDAYENSNGIVDCFDDEQGVKSEDFIKFNDDIVLLAKLKKHTFFESETIKIPALISIYSQNASTEAAFIVSLKDDTKTYICEKMENISILNNGVFEICKLDLTLPLIKTSKKMKLHFELSIENGKKYENEWDIWVYKKTNKKEIDAVIDMKADYIKNNYIEKPDSNIIVTDKLDDNLFYNLSIGKNVILLYRTDWTRHVINKNLKPPKYSFSHSWGRFKPVIWDRGTNYGGIADKDLLSKYGFVSDDVIDFQYYNLIEDCDKINLDDFPIKVKSIISGIDKCTRDRFDVSKFGLRELQYDKTLRNFSYLFELKVGKGKLLVTGFNFTEIENRDPAVKAMFEMIIKYSNSQDFNPQNEINVNDLKEYLSKKAQSGPQKESIMTQFWQIDSEPIESKEFWIESERYLRQYHANMIL